MWKTHTEPVHANMMAGSPFNGQCSPPMRCIVGPFQPMGLPVVFRTMVRSNRLIKLNRANESRANPAWGMRACVRACRSFVRLQTSSCMLTHYTIPSEITPGRTLWEIYRATRPPASWCCEFNDDLESVAFNNAKDLWDMRGELLPRVAHKIIEINSLYN